MNNRFVLSALLAILLIGGFSNEASAQCRRYGHSRPRVVVRYCPPPARYCPPPPVAYRSGAYCGRPRYYASRYRGHHNHYGHGYRR